MHLPVEQLGGKGLPFRGPLDLDEFAGARHHHVEIDLGPDIFRIIQVDQNRSVDDADADRRHTVTNGSRPPANLSRIESSASTRARNPPVILAVRVPPSASSTSQSTVTVRAPSAATSTTARKLRPMSRWISWLRPSIWPRSRFLRGAVLPGNMLYSAVTQPVGDSCLAFQGGTDFVDAGGAQNGGATGLNQHAAGCSGREVPANRQRAQRIGGTAVISHGGRLVQQPDQQTLGQVHPIFRLPKHDTLGAVHHFVGHFQPTLGGQVVHEARPTSGPAPSALALTWNGAKIFSRSSACDSCPMLAQTSV